MVDFLHNKHHRFMSLFQGFLAMMRRAVLFSMVVTFGWLASSCGSPPIEAANPNSPQAQPAVQSAQSPAPATTRVRLADGQYPVQQASYDDGSGSYRMMLLNTPPGQPSLLEVANVPMARLTDEEVAKGTKSYLKVEQGQPALVLSEDFKIEYVHNVAETVQDPQTGQPQTVIVRQESSFWTPFAGALAGQAIGSLLFTPHYYMPPIYRPGITLVGHGGYGGTYDQAVSSYQSRYKAPPAEVRNRQVFRTTGRIRSAPSGFGRTSPALNPTNRQRTQRPDQGRSSGSGFGTNTLRPNNSRSKVRQSRPSSGFGSGGARMRRPAMRRR